MPAPRFAETGMLLTGTTDGGTTDGGTTDGGTTDGGTTTDGGGDDTGGGGDDTGGGGGKDCREGCGGDGSSSHFLLLPLLLLAGVRRRK